VTTYMGEGVTQVPRPRPPLIEIGSTRIVVGTPNVSISAMSTAESKGREGVASLVGGK